MPFEWRTDPDTGNQVQVWVAGPQQGMGSLPPQGMGSLASFEAATKPATTHQAAVIGIPINPLIRLRRRGIDGIQKLTSLIEYNQI